MQLPKLYAPAAAWCKGGLQEYNSTIKNPSAHVRHISYSKFAAPKPYDPAEEKKKYHSEKKKGAK